MSTLWRVLRFCAALLAAAGAATLTVFSVATGDDGWRLVGALVLGGLVGGMAFTAVKDGPRALVDALVRGRASAGSASPAGSRARRAPRR